MRAVLGAFDSHTRYRHPRADSDLRPRPAAGGGTHAWPAQQQRRAQQEKQPHSGGRAPPRPRRTCRSAGWWSARRPVRRRSTPSPCTGPPRSWRPWRPPPPAPSAGPVVTATNMGASPTSRPPFPVRAGRSTGCRARRGRAPRGPASAAPRGRGSPTRWRPRRRGRRPGPLWRPSLRCRPCTWRAWSRRSPDRRRPWPTRRRAPPCRRCRTRSRTRALRLVQLLMIDCRVRRSPPIPSELAGSAPCYVVTCPPCSSPVCTAPR